MKNIILYEAKKLIKAKSVVILCALLAVFNIVISFFGVPSENVTTQEKYDKVAESVIYTAKVNLSQIVDKESESALYQKDIIARFEKLRGNVKVTPVKGYDSLLMSPYPYLSALVFCVWAALHLAFAEYSANLTLLSSKEKRGKIAVAKLAALAACALGSVLIFSACYSLGTLFAAGFGGALAPVQSIAAYIRCPYEINVLTAMVMRVLFAFAAALLAAVAVFCVSLAVKKIIPALVCIIAFVGLDYVATDAAKTDIFALFYNFNFRVLTEGTFLARYSGIKLGVFVTQPFIMLAVLVLGVAAFALLSLLIFRKMRSIKGVYSPKIGGRNGAASGKNLAFYELKKLFRGKTVILVFVLVIFKIFTLNAQVKEPNSDYENVYKYYLSEMEDMSYPTQGAYVTREIERSAKAIEEAEAYMNAYIDGEEEDHDKFLEYASELGAEELKHDVLVDINAQLAKVSVMRDKGVDAKLIYATGWDALFSLSADYICVILLAFVLVPYTMLDKESKFAPIMRASVLGRQKEGKRLRARKMLLMFAFAALVSLAFFALDLWLVNERIGLNSFGEYAVGTVLPEPLWGLRIWQVLLIRVAMAFAGILAIIAVTRLVEKFAPNTMAALLIFALSQFLAVLISNMANIFFIFDLSSFFKYMI